MAGCALDHRSDRHANDKDNSDYQRAKPQEGPDGLPSTTVSAVSPAVDIVPARLSQSIADDPNGRQHGQREHERKPKSLQPAPD